MPAIDSVEYLQNAPSPGYSARQLRGSYLDAYGEGVFGSADYRVTFSAGLTLNVAAGTAYIRGASSAVQGLYRADNTTTRTVTLAAADGTNPRLDQIILQVRDSAEDGGANNDGQVTVIQGTPTPGTTLDNRNGVPVTTLSSPSYILIADVLVNAGNSPALGAGNIRDRRPFALPGVIPSSITTAVKDQVAFQNPVIPLVGTAWNASYNTRQVAMAMFLPRRIPATHVRWRYIQDANNSSAAYNIAICDASGRLISQIGSTALAGANNTATKVVAPLLSLPAGYIFDAGWYYVWAGLSAIGTGGTPPPAIGFSGFVVDPAFFQVGSANNAYTTPQQNMVFRSPNAGNNQNFDPSGTILNMADAYNDTANTGVLPLPQIALSVG